MANRRRWLGLSILGVLVLACAAALALSWSTLVMDVFYEDWTASQYPSGTELTRKKRSALLPGPEFVQMEISLERFTELEQIAVGGEYSAATIVWRPNAKSVVSEAAHRVIYLSPDAGQLGLDF